MRQLFQVLHEDAGLLVVNKPSGLVCHPTKTDEYSSLISRARLHLGAASHPQLVNRLDRETSGVTLIAKTAATAYELRKLWEQRQVLKEYKAVVHGHMAGQHCVIEAPLGKDDSSKVAIKDCVRLDGAAASTEFRVEHTFYKMVAGEKRGFSVLTVLPQTGRKHQIRIHLAHVGHPIVGDKLYGGDEDLYLALVQDRLTEDQRQRLMLPHHALHAARVQFTWGGKEWLFEAEPEDWFTRFIASEGAG